jgi:MYXO-CTERM domain-containing protein
VAKADKPKKRKKHEDTDVHDVLAAEEFPPPAGADADTPESRAHRLPPDPAGTEAPHDVLAAEEYPPPAGADADTAAARARRLPPDPAGTTAPHDVLAAEEYPPPAHADVMPEAEVPSSPLPRILAALAAAGLGYALVRRRR